MFKSKVGLIFKDSINKLNQIINRLDTQSGFSKSFVTSVSNKAEPEESKQVKSAPKQSNKSKQPNIQEAKESNLFDEVDIRVGKVLSLDYLENSENIYLLKVDLDEEALRDIGTGLRKYVKEDQLLNQNVIVFANLKPKKLGESFYSNGMIMSAHNENNELELVRPNENAKPGESVFVEGGNPKELRLAPLNDKKFKRAIVNFKSDEECFACYENKKLLTVSGPVKVKSLKNSQIS